MDSKNDGQGGIVTSSVNYSCMNDGDRALVTPPGTSAVAATLPAAVKVTSPADLPRGYQFTVVLEENRAWVVEVPEGGVLQGQRFTARVLHESSLEGDGCKQPPLGEWRDGLFDCFDKGLCHPHLCLSWCCTPIALAQILTRLRLDWFGSPIESPTTGNNGWSTFKIITTLYLVYFVFEYTVMFVTIPYSLNGEDPEEPTWSRMLDAINNAVAIAYAMYLLIVMTRTRAYIRSKYNIPEKDCAGCEDCCFSYFCRCCVVAQMARHINDYDRYSADCCSETGVTASAPELV